MIDFSDSMVCGSLKVKRRSGVLDSSESFENSDMFVKPCEMDCVSGFRLGFSCLAVVRVGTLVFYIFRCQFR